MGGKMKAGIYGAGDFGQRLFDIFCQMNFQVDCFIQSDKTDDVELKGKPFCL